MPEPKSKPIEIPLGDDGEPLMVVSRHVALMRPHLFKVCDENMKPGGRPALDVFAEMTEFPDGELLLVYDAATGSRVWVQSLGGRTDGYGRFFLRQAGVLMDTEGTHLRVPPGFWRVQPQAAQLSGGAQTFGFYPFRYVY